MLTFSLFPQPDFLPNSLAVFRRLCAANELVPLPPSKAPYPYQEGRREGREGERRQVSTEKRPQQQQLLLQQQQQQLLQQQQQQYMYK